VKKISSAWIIMENRESYRVRRRQHWLEWLQLCRKSIVAGKHAYYLQCIFPVIKVRTLRMKKS